MNTLPSSSVPSPCPPRPGRTDWVRVLAHFKWIVLAVAATVLGTLGYLLVSGLPPSQIRITTSPLTIAQLQPIQDLTLLRVPMTTVIEADRHGRLRLGGLSCRLTVAGEALLGTDLGAGRVEQIDQGRCTAVLVLPEPRVQIAKVDMQRSKVYNIDRHGLWVFGIGEAGTSSQECVNQAYAKAQEWIREAGSQPEHIAQAKEQAEAVIIECCRRLGWTVTVRWA